MQWKKYYLPQLNTNVLQVGENIEIWVILEICKEFELEMLTTYRTRKLNLVFGE